MKRSLGGSQSNLSRWLFKKERTEPPPSEETEAVSEESREESEGERGSAEREQSPSTSAATPPAEVVPVSSGHTEQPSAPTSVHPNDFGNVFEIGVRNLSDEQKLKFLTEFYTPPPQPESVWPTETRMTKTGPSIRRLRPDHLQRPEAQCLAFSPALGGLFCRFCALFITETDAQRHHFGNQKITLVHEPLKKFSRMFGRDGYITSHVQREYHKFSSERAERFIAVMRSIGTSIQERLDKEDQDRIANRRKLLRPMIETTLVLARSGLAFRGHRDSGPITVPSSSVFELDPEEGNFRTLLGYRAMYDTDLAQHLIKGGKNAQYSSKRIQNEIIATSAKLVQKSIVGDVNKAGYFSVLADETSDVARLEQLSISVRYVGKGDQGKNMVEEKFLAFVEAAECSGPALAELIMTTLMELGLDLNLLVGQGYDGATSMSGVRGGVQALIRQRHPCALYVHCCAHLLNLTLIKASSVVGIRHAFAVMTKICTFFRTSPKRSQVLRDAIDRHAPESQRRTLRSLCETRWVERAEACSSFKALYTPVIAALAEISETEPEAHSYMICVTEKRFTFALCLLAVAMGAFKTLSEQLQSSSNTLPKALLQQRLLSQQLRSWIEKAEGVGCFERIKQDYNRVLREIAELQLVSSHTGYETTEDEFHFFEDKIYAPFLHGLLEEMETRFSSHFALAAQIQLLLPETVKNTTIDDFRDTFGFYSDMLPHQDMTLFETEYEAWKLKWAEDPSPAELLVVLDNCDQSFFPIVHSLLQILVTLPVSTATPERTFSSLKFLKNYLRNTMKEDRLTGLALLYIHRSIDIKIEDVIDEFVTRNRRISFT